MMTRQDSQSSRLQLFAGALVLSAPVFFSSHARGDVVTIGPSKDNTLYQSNDGSVFSNGAGVYFFVGRTQQGEFRRGLMQFDSAGAVPAGATITDVQLQVRMNKTIADIVPVTLHRTTASWGEGNSDAGIPGGGGGTASNGDCSWDLRFVDPPQPWTTPGGDFVSTPSGSTLVGQAGFYTWNSTPGLVADVQAWLDSPATNFGWLIKGVETGELPTAKRFVTRENTTVANRPQLTITYTAGPTCGDLDFNNDTLFPDSTDLDDFVAVLAGGPSACSTGAGLCDSIDFNGDGLFPDADDLDAFIRRLAGGPCFP
jgi:hypothetical protein